MNDLSIVKTFLILLTLAGIFILASGSSDCDGDTTNCIEIPVDQCVIFIEPEETEDGE